ncbi:unnamed protein product [Tetraodon nigroviridis]|uniref:(spotted green pufferfish) hypothetical protein n=1 Tax=Tetraodon nigroviridis TaxID=99883 RepID=Q4RV58_TETNG|nr:unnamed protein product [Tetraodon nigroviridis]
MDRPPRLCSVPTAPPEGSTGPPTMRLAVISTTGSPVELTIPRGETVEGLRTHLSRRLRLRADRIVLVHKHRITAGCSALVLTTDGSWQAADRREPAGAGGHRRQQPHPPACHPGWSGPSNCGGWKKFQGHFGKFNRIPGQRLSVWLSPIYITLEVGTHVMYVELQLSGQDVTELQRKQDPGAENIHPSATDTWVPGRSSSQFSPRRPRTRLNSKDCASLSERAAQTRTCWDGSCSSCSSPGQASASACPRHSWSQQRGSSSAEGPTPAPAVKKVGVLSSFAVTTHR